MSLQPSVPTSGRGRLTLAAALLVILAAAGALLVS